MSYYVIKVSSRDDFINQAFILMVSVRWCEQDGKYGRRKSSLLEWRACPTMWVGDRMWGKRQHFPQADGVCWFQVERVLESCGNKGVSCFFRQRDKFTAVARRFSGKAGSKERPGSSLFSPLLKHSVFSHSTQTGKGELWREGHFF